MPKIHRYEGETLTVLYDVTRCIHAAECVRGLPAVFDTQRRPWVIPDAANAGEIADVILRCPSGALHYEHRDGGPAEEPSTENAVTVISDGPLYLRGRIEIADPDGNVSLADTRIALCRCGASNNKPFCDLSHKQAGFEDPGLWPADAVTGTPSEDPVLRVVCRPNGPLILEGLFLLRTTDGRSAIPRKRILCRCGASKNKPFCDGSHAHMGFQSSNPPVGPPVGPPAGD
ncbi:MAG: hypothetical protein QOF89_3088 [Acidobacteriota bacterium]|nr:hypothetical protein [Acidobacteriota bacterium]